MLLRNLFGPFKHCVAAEKSDHCPAIYKVAGMVNEIGDPSRIPAGRLTLSKRVGLDLTRVYPCAGVKVLKACTFTRFHVDLHDP